jgi:hypothetical protein
MADVNYAGIQPDFKIRVWKIVLTFSTKFPWINLTVSADFPNDRWVCAWCGLIICDQSCISLTNKQYGTYFQVNILLCVPTPPAPTTTILYSVILDM